MARGKQSASQNLRLRNELKAAVEARRNLERRLVETEADRDDAIARLAEVEGVAHPAIVAERIRADAASAATHRRVTAYRDQLSIKLDQLTSLLARGVKRAATEGVPKWTGEEMDELRDLLGRGRFSAFMAEATTKELSRASRRAMLHVGNLDTHLRERS